MSRPTVVKVGGSLYDLPDLGPRLERFLSARPSPVLLVPGGGPTADVIRRLDESHRLGEEASHWLALRACALNAHFLAALLLGTPVTGRLPLESPRAILDPHAFALEDESRPDHWPHRWDVTSDSMAVRAAGRCGAGELILLKSESWPDSERWDAAAARGFVDAFFPAALARTPGLRVRAVNLRG